MNVDVRTDRLVLRRWQGADLEPFAQLNADAEVMRFFPAALSRADSDGLAARADAMFDLHGYGLWALERRDTGAFIGFTGLAPMLEGVPGAGGVEVGWRLARSAWGQGFATEAATAALRFGFGRLGLAEVNAITAVINIRSRQVMERLGMTPANEFEHPRLPVGSPLRRHVRYLLAAPDRRTGPDPSRPAHPQLTRPHCSRSGQMRPVRRAHLSARATVAASLR